jgi:NADPH:quinone reductase-like Zn-dependent oxidoreductase
MAATTSGWPQRAWRGAVPRGHHRPFRRGREVRRQAEGNAVGASAATLRELAELVAAGDLEVPIAAIYPLRRVREGYSRPETGHIRGKIVLIP